MLYYAIRSNAVAELERIVDAAFWQLLTESQWRYLSSRDSLRDAWRYCWDGELMTLIVRYARDGVVPASAERKFEKARKCIERAIDVVMEAGQAGYEQLMKLAGELDDESDSDAKVALQCAADRFRTACWSAMRREVRPDLEALAWKYALPEFPEKGEEQCQANS